MTSAEARIIVRSAEAAVGSLPRINPPGQWTLFWRRFKRHRFALGSLIVFVLCASRREPVITRALGHGPNEPSPFASGETLRPVGPWTHVRDATSTSEALATHKT